MNYSQRKVLVLQSESGAWEDGRARFSWLPCRQEANLWGNLGKEDEHFAEWGCCRLIHTLPALQAVFLQGSGRAPRSLQPTPPSLPLVAEPRKAHQGWDPRPGYPGTVPGHPSPGDVQLGEGMWSGDQFPGGGPGRRLPPEPGRRENTKRSSGESISSCF